MQNFDVLNRLDSEFWKTLGVVLPFGFEKYLHFVFCRVQIGAFGVQMMKE